jgi:hypothetical protein
LEGLRCDLILCSGILYHLDQPWILVDEMTTTGCTDILMWTHYSSTDDIVHGDYKGSFYTEHGFSDPLSGLANSSFWLSRSELFRMLNERGLSIQSILDEQPNPPQPSILLHLKLNK